MHDTSDRRHCLRLGKILATVGDKWTVMVIGLLARGTLRHSELKRGMDGVSQRMLTLTLRSLERDGLVSREVFPTIPPRVEYTLTPLGHTLIKPLKALADWAEAHVHEIEDSQARHDRQAAPPPGIAPGIPSSRVLDRFSTDPVRSTAAGSPPRRPASGRASRPKPPSRGP